MKSSVYAFIPARGGSVGVPGKNLRKLHGKPLILHTLDFALRQPQFEKIIVSTDSSQIAEIVLKHLLSGGADWESLNDDDVLAPRNGNVYVHKRPINEALSLSPIRDTLYKFAKREDVFSEFDYLCMLQPTSPFRRGRELLEILERANVNESWTSIVSVTEVDGYHPDRMFRLNEDGYLASLVNQTGEDNKPRQLLEKLYIKDGAYYFLKKTELLCDNLLGRKPVSYLRNGLCTVNIDKEADFILANAIENPYQERA